MQEFDSSYKASRIVTRIIDLLQTMDSDKLLLRLVPGRKQTRTVIQSLM